jgi:hypothetical protein
MSYLRYLCLLANSGVLGILCCVFVFCFLLWSSCVPYVSEYCLRIVMSYAYCVVVLFSFSSSCVSYVASYYGWSIFDCPFGVL